MRSNKDSGRRRSVADDRSQWDLPFKPQDTLGLAQDIEEHDAIARRLRLSLPLEQRMNVWLRRPRTSTRGSR
jgi:hypothetical protein